MPTPAQRVILGILFAGVLVAALDIAIVGPALPAIRSAFDVGSRALSWVFSAYVLFYVVGAPLLAKLSDRTGRRAVYAQSLGLFAAGSALVAAAPTFELLLLGRAIQACGAGGIFPVATAVIAETVASVQRGRGHRRGRIGVAAGRRGPRRRGTRAGRGPLDVASRAYAHRQRAGRGPRARTSLCPLGGAVWARLHDPRAWAVRVAVVQRREV